MWWIVLVIIVAVVLLSGLGGLFFLRRGKLPDEVQSSRPGQSLSRSESASGTAVLDRKPDPVPTGEVDVDDALVDDALVVDEPVIEEPPVVEAPQKPRFRDRLGKARSALSGYFGSVLGRDSIDAETWEELEEALILADVGVPTTMKMLERCRERVKADKLDKPEALMQVLREEMTAELSGGSIELSRSGSPSVWMFVGVNGVGKTTTIGKLAKREVADGASVVLAAGDTFRAAAAEQLEMWSERSGAAFIRGAEGADPGSVVFDAIEHAAAANVDLVMADTAGRLHTKTNLMEELGKVRRVAEKGAGTVTEVLLVIDATTGQNGLTQAKQFTEAADVTGVALTKLDGSAKGGIVLAIQSELGIPVKLVGLGEGPDDLVEFDANEFVDALFT